MVRIAVLRESAPSERRVAATPETVKKLIALGAVVAVESGAGVGANIPDASFAEAGAQVAAADAVLAGADLVCTVQGAVAESLRGIASGARLLGLLDPIAGRERVAQYAAAGIEALAMEWIPRITRAQSMDVLSSQANLSGYKAVIDSAAAYGRVFPLMMTAAGTVPAARVFIMGVGVAGLQAIATARRLGAQVSATDVRAATREQIESLGAKAIFVEKVAGISGEGAGGYATEMSPEYQAAQAELVSGHLAKQDIVITTALIPGRAAPRLISDAQIATMKPGSVIFDLAVGQGGNVEGSLPDCAVVRHGVTLLGYSNTPSHLATEASALYARNLYNFIAAYWNKERSAIELPDDDEIVQGVRLTREGSVIHPRLAAGK
jgi:H+-translocating NAD(P) transhydrogenase subunit alpha